jgi:hypothetical protein
LTAGQHGAGMKWYTQEPSRVYRAALPYRPRPKGVKSFSATQSSTIPGISGTVGGQENIELSGSSSLVTKRERSQAESEKALSSNFDAEGAEDGGGKADYQSPAVVSSEMVRPEST